MRLARNLIFALVICLGMGISGTEPASALGMQGEGAAPTPATSPVRTMGTVKSVSGSEIVLGTDTGAEIHVRTQDSTRMLRVAPGQKDLKDASPIRLEDLHTGDRILVRGSSAGDVIQATSIIAMKQLDIAAKQEQEREDWQKRGIGGLVGAVDTQAGTITVSTVVSGAKKNVLVKISGATVIRRYAPGSVKFDDAKLGKLDEIKTGDQLRARGTLSADGGELNAEEVVSGTFRNIAGTILTISASDNSIRVTDLATKQPVVIKVNSDSQLRKLPPMLAQVIARRLKAPEDGNGQPPAAEQAGGGRSGARSGRTADLQQILQRVPPVTLAELQKGDAVMVVATQGEQAGQVTAIRLLSGVEPILSASPSGNDASSLLSPWNIGGGEAAAQ